MKWLHQFSLVMRSNVTSLRESMEDPERMLHQLLIDMEEELDRVRGSVADAIADEIQLRKRAQRETDVAKTWSDRANQAVRRGDETHAKLALEQKLVATERSAQFHADHEAQKAEVTKLERGVHDLEDKIRQAKQKKTLLAARMARASSAQKINSVMERTNSQSAFAQFNRFEEKVDREEAVTQAWDRMQGKDPDAEELAREFEQENRQKRIVSELEELKQNLREP